jgi:hypothetical protein
VFITAVPITMLFASVWVGIMARKPLLLKSYASHFEENVTSDRDWNLEYHVHDDGDTSKRPFYRLVLSLDASQINKSVLTSASSG